MIPHRAACQNAFGKKFFSFRKNASDAGHGRGESCAGKFAYCSGQLLFNVRKKRLVKTSARVLPEEKMPPIFFISQ